MASLSDKNVRRFDIAMNNLFGMCSIQGVGNFDCYFQNALRVQTVRGNQVLESLRHPDTPWR